MRNSYAHPKNLTKEEVLEQAIKHLQEMPDLSELGNIEIDEKIYWSDADNKTCLFPFAYQNDNIISTFSEFIYPDQLLFNNPNIDAEIDFKKSWNNIKYLDIELSQPTNNDLLIKINKAHGNKKYEGEPPQWCSEMLNFSEIGMLVRPGIANGILSNLHNLKKSLL